MKKMNIFALLLVLFCTTGTYAQQPCPNVVTNGDFSSDLQNWTYNDSRDVAVVDNSNYKGKNDALTAGEWLSPMRGNWVKMYNGGPSDISIRQNISALSGKGTKNLTFDIAINEESGKVNNYFYVKLNDVTVLTLKVGGYSPYMWTVENIGAGVTINSIKNLDQSYTYQNVSQGTSFNQYQNGATFFNSNYTYQYRINLTVANMTSGAGTLEFRGQSFVRYFLTNINLTDQEICSGTLPVKISAFTLNKNTLNWSVGVEANVDKYIVQGSNTAETDDWKDLGEVKAKGNASYSYVLKNISVVNMGIGSLTGIVLLLSLFFVRRNRMLKTTMMVLFISFAGGSIISCKKDTLAKPKTKENETPYQFYRLKVMDKDGSVEYSQVIKK